MAAAKLPLCGLLVLIALICTVSRAEIVQGELHVDVGMTFDPVEHKILSTSHSFHVRTDGGQDIPLDVDETEKESLMAHGASSRVEIDGTRGPHGFKGRVSNGPGRPNGKRQAGWLVSPRMTALGDMNVLFFLVNLQTADPAYKWSSAAIPSGLTTSFERLRQDFLRSSWGQLNLVSRKRDGTFGFYGLYNTPAVPGCTSTTRGDIATYVQTQFADDAWWNGYGGQTIHVFLWPDQMSNLCGSAWGNIGHPGNVWSQYAEYLLEHEFGHVIGMYHAGLATGTSAEYGDCSDVMGCLASSATPVNLVTGGSHNNGPHKVGLGWTLNQPVREVKMTTASTTQAISLAPISRATTTIPQIVSMGSADAYGTTFPGLGSHFISFRVPDGTAGIEDNIPVDYQGVNIHQQTAGRSFLLGVLKTAGQIFEINGKPDMYARITLVSISTTQANIKVSYMPLVSTALAPVTTPLQYFPIIPIRLIDTRSSTSVAVYAGSGAFSSGESRLYYVGGYAGTRVPGTARGLAIVTTSISPAGGGYATIWPNGAARPVASSLNFVTGQFIASAAYPALGPNGGLNLFSSISAGFCMDIMGYYAPATTGGLWFKPLPSPVRIIETRPGYSAIYNTGAALTAGTTLTRNMRVGGVSATAAAISATCAVVPQVGPGWMAAYQGGIAYPGHINAHATAPINVEAASPIALNPADGTMNMIVSNTAHLVFDVDGYFEAGSGVGFMPLAGPIRLVDTRAGQTAFYAGSGTIAAGTSRTFNLAGVTYNGITVPSTATVLVGTFTVVPGGANGYLTVYPAGVARPGASQLQYNATGAVAQGLHVRSGTNGGVNFFASQNINLVVDITGYYTAVAGVAASGVTRADATSSSSSGSSASPLVIVAVVAAIVVVVAVVAAVAVVVVRRNHRARHADKLAALISPSNEDI